MFHPHTGATLAVDRYRPSAELRRFLRVRDERCRFPGCTPSDRGGAISTIRATMPSGAKHVSATWRISAGATTP